MKKVYLVGAGPGDPSLATCRAVELIAGADYIIYDYLLPEDLLAGSKTGASLICVGKRAGQHSAKQEEINSLILKCYAKAPPYGIIVRLKGGDPFIFGRGGEEAEILAEAGIPFEVVPGVSSAVAVPAYAGIPLTHRGYSSSVSIFTGHGSAGNDNATATHIPDAAASGETLVFLMGMSRLEELCEKLLIDGLDPQTPAAVIEWGTTPRQRKILGELGNIASKSLEAGLSAPSVIVVGKVVGLANKLEWFEKRPLWGKKIVVTRSRRQSSKLSTILRNLGAEVLELPSISITPLPLEKGEERFFSSPFPFNWLAFTSSNGVEELFRHLYEKGLDARNIGSCKVAAIGSETAKSLRQYGIVADFVPSAFVAESFAKEFAEFLKKEESTRGSPYPCRILIARGSKGRGILEKTLKEEGYSVESITLYDTVKPDANDLLASQEAKLVNLWETGQIDCVTFTSTTTVHNFFAALPENLLQGRKMPLFACIGPTTAKALEEYGFCCTIAPAQCTVQHLAAAVEEAFVGVVASGLLPSGGVKKSFYSGPAL